MDNERAPTEAELREFYGSKLKNFQPHYVTEGQRLAGPSQLALDQRTITYICKKWGSLRDVPKPLIPVIWVSTRQCFKVVMTAEMNGELSPIKNALLGDRKLMPDFKKTILVIDFIAHMISCIRSEQSDRRKSRIAQLAIDILKWRMMEDAVETSVFRRFIIRKFATAHPDYAMPVPPEISV